MNMRKILNRKAREKVRTASSKALCYVLAAVMALSSALPAFAPAVAYADDFSSHMAFMTLDNGLTGEGVYAAQDGSVAFCADVYHQGPNSEGTGWNNYYNGWYWAGADITYAVVNGYPFKTKIGGVQLTADEARWSTQNAIWMLRGQIGPDGVADYWYSWDPYHTDPSNHQMYDLKVDNPNPKCWTAAKALYDGAVRAARSKSVPEKMVRMYRSIPGLGGYPRQTVVYVPEVGQMGLDKRSANPEITEGSDLYSLEGAEYGIYADSGCTNLVQTMTTDKNGHAESGFLEEGTYYVKETKAPEGYALDSRVYPTNITPYGYTEVNGGTVYDPALNDPAGILVGKFDGEKTYTGAGNLPQGSASLAGAEFTVRYYDGFYDTEKQAEASGEPTRTWVFATDEDGFASLNASYHVGGDQLYLINSGQAIIPRGTIVIRETKAPAGYNLNTEFVSVQKIKAPGDASLESTYNTPQAPEEVKRGGVKITKVDAQTGSTPQGGADFEDIEFSIINDNENSVVVDGVSYAKGAVVKTVVTGKDGVAKTSSDALPFGRYIIRETASNSDYQITAEDIRATVSEDGEVYSFTAKDQVARGGVRVSKRDLESGLSDPLGAASIDGTRFDVKSLNDNPVICGNVTFGKGDVITTLAIRDGEAATAPDLLPVGRYSIQEVATGDGYLLTDGTAYEFDVTRNGEVVDGPAKPVKNQVKRGDLEFVKVREDDMSRLAGVPFLITSETTGEAHVVVTDENGYASTSAEWNKHSHKTNANDDVDDEADYVAEAGVWFGLAEDGSTVPTDDKLGALPYDKYTIEELPVAANDGLQLIRLEGVTIKRDSVTVDLGTIDDRNETEAYIHTTAHDAADGDKLIAADDLAAVTDHVEFTGLTPGAAYVMTATLMDQETGKAIADSVSKQFVPAGPSGSVEMEIPVDLIDYAGKKVVVFEELTRDGRTVCDHKDLDDSEQTLRVLVPQIGTTAKDGIDGDQEAVIDPEAVIVDTVHYKNLAPGREYTVKGQLMVKSTGEALKGEDGKPVTAKTVFTPQDANGTVDVTFTFDAHALSGESVVAFETLYRKGKELASHANIDDLGQTIEFSKPSVATVAVDGADGDKHGATDPEAVIVDTVSYAGVIPGKEYTVKGQLLVKSAGESLEGEDGEPVTAEAVFTPTDTYGTVEVAFSFDATDLDGESIVVFETLYRDGVKIASHADIDDLGQTVEFAKPSIATLAKDAVDGDHQAIVDPEAVIVDTVSYTGLVPGKEYVVKGRLMDKGTGDALEVEGEPVSAEAAFVPEHSSGTVDVAYNLDAHALAGKDVVVFETLYRTGKEICAHEDIDDLGQTIEFVKPSLTTVAKDGVDGDSYVVADGKATLTDTVSYAGVIAGKEYTVVGKLMNKETGESLEGEGGKSVTAEAVFTPDHDHGSVDVTFEFDCLQLAGKDVVVFEALYRMGKKVASHADIDDLGQTVTVVQPAIDTVAVDGYGDDKQAVIDPEARISDKVAFDQVIPGATYEVHGIVMDGATGLPVLSDDGEGDLPSEEEVAEFWQSLIDLSGVKIAEPFMAASNKSVASGESGFLGWLGSLFGIGDAVEPAQDATGNEEDAANIWFPPAKPDWKGIEALLKDSPEIASRLVRGSAEMIPEKASGEVVLDFAFDATGMANRDAVAFELLVKDGYAVAAHADLADEDQTVSFFEPAIGTKAADGLDGDQSIVADGKATLIDTVTYEDLIPSKEYKVSGTLMVKDTEEALLDGDGKPVTAETVFTPDHDHGTVDVTFEFDASLLAGQKIVAFETLSREGKEICSHADIEDKGQTVDVVQPALDTKASDGLDGDKSVVADPEAKITDTLSFKNVIPDAAYEAYGIVMDGKTGLPLLSGDGASKVDEKDLADFWDELCELSGIYVAKPLGNVEQAEESGEVWFPQVEPDWEGIERLLEGSSEIVEHLSMAKSAFEADKDHGEIVMDFGLDASDLAGKDAVVFELLVKDGIAVAAHADLADADQTVAIVSSSIGTEATDKSDGDHEVMVSKKAIVVDTVTYENLIPGKEYVLRGVLMDKATAKPLMVGDRPVEVEKSFTPNKATGKVEVEFEFDASALDGHELVVFETLYKDGIEVAAHADIDDAAQTVKVSKGPNGTVFDKTGFDGNVLAMAGTAVVLAVAALIGYGIVQRKKAGKADGEASADTGHDAPEDAE